MLLFLERFLFPKLPDAIVNSRIPVPRSASSAEMNLMGPPPRPIEVMSNRALVSV